MNIITWSVFHISHRNSDLEWWFTGYSQRNEPCTSVIFSMQFPNPWKQNCFVLRNPVEILYFLQAICFINNQIYFLHDSLVFWNHFKKSPENVREKLKYLVNKSYMLSQPSRKSSVGDEICFFRRSVNPLLGIHWSIRQSTADPKLFRNPLLCRARCLGTLGVATTVDWR